MPTTIYTETSMYLLDRKNKEIIRFPGEGHGVINGDDVPTTEMRKDFKPVKLIEMTTCEIGKPLEMIIDVREDGVHTIRASTIVRAIVDDN